MLKKVCKLKSFKFLDFEDFENKQFFRVLEEEDEIYKGIVGYGQDDAIIKEGKGKKNIKTVDFLKDNEKMIRKKEKEFTNMRTGMFMKASLKIIYSKEKEY